jgi:hypothetical protein
LVQEAEEKRAALEAELERQRQEHEAAAAKAQAGARVQGRWSRAVASSAKAQDKAARQAMLEEAEVRSTALRHALCKFAYRACQTEYISLSPRPRAVLLTVFLIQAKRSALELELGLVQAAAEETTRAAAEAQAEAQAEAVRVTEARLEEERAQKQHAEDARAAAEAQVANITQITAGERG